MEKKVLSFFNIAAAAAKLLQLCPTLRDPMGCSLPGSSTHGIFQARVPEWGTIAFSLSAIGNIATMNMGVQVSFQDPVFNSLGGICPELRFLDYMLVLFLIF